MNAFEKALSTLPPLSDQPRVLVVTPSLNQGHFIRMTIESVLAQDYPHLRYVVMDGGSTDSTLDVLRSYSGRFEWVSEPDNGQSAAINAAWRRDDSEIITWLNADDVYEPGAVSAIVAAFRTYPDAAVVYGDCVMVDVQGRAIGWYPASPFDLGDVLRTTIPSIPQPAAFIRRAAIECVGYLDERLHMAMDLDLWVRIALHYPLRYIPRALARFRVHAGSKSVAKQVSVVPELLAIYARVLADPACPPAILSDERRIMSLLMLRIANLLFAAGRYDSAQRYARASWRMVPVIQHRSMLKFMLFELIGDRSYWIHRQVHRWRR